MTLNLSMPSSTTELKPRIVVFGVGGAGGNAVNNMISANLEGVEFVVTNTDAQSLSQSLTERRIQLGIGLTQGLGAGSRPDVGRAAAEEARDAILDQLQGSHMVFITAGMGGGTGTGAAPVIAQLARECGILTVGVVTKPFQFEGAHRFAIAEQGIEELHEFVDTLIIIPNQNLFRVANEKTTFADAFKMADDVLYSGVRGVTDLMVMPGLINLDFADIRTIMMEMGKAMMGTGEAEGDKRSLESAEAAISNPLLDDVTMKGAKAVLINITGGPDMTLFEVDEAANRIRDEVDPDANIIFGSTFDDKLEGSMRVSVVATGIESEGMARRNDGDARARGPGYPPAQVPEPADHEGSEVVPLRPDPPAPAAAELGGLQAPGAEAAARATALARAVQAETKAAEQVQESTVRPLEGSARVEESMAKAPSRAEATPAEGDFFIPAAPARPTPTSAPEPFAEAAMTNGGGGERKRPASLLERIASAGRARRAATEEEAKVPSEPTPSEPVEAVGKPAPAVSEAATPSPRPAASAELAGPAAQPNEDLLEIPAFLRRQAN